MFRKKSKKRKNFIIALVVLALLICFLVGLKYRSSTPTSENIAQPVSANVVLTSPTPAPTPSPTPFPTKEPKELTVSEVLADPYPELYGDNPSQQFDPKEDKIVYLTFDDGPSGSTPALLEVLKEEGAPATFFITETRFPHLLQQIYQDGHTLGVHTHSHDYNYVYWTKDSFLADFSRCYHTIWDATGYRPRIFRFPGGSVNSYNRDLIWDLVTEMEGRGFVYYDWNVTSEDASTAKTYEEQFDALIAHSGTKSRIIALLHDTAKNNEISLVVREYIRYMKERGYRFAALDSSVAPIQFSLP